jgi:hypothetical protein
MRRTMSLGKRRSRSCPFDDWRDLGQHEVDRVPEHVFGGRSRSMRAEPTTTDHARAGQAGVAPSVDANRRGRRAPRPCPRRTGDRPSRPSRVLTLRRDLRSGYGSTARAPPEGPRRLASWTGVPGGPSWRRPAHSRWRTATGWLAAPPVRRHRSRRTCSRPITTASPWPPRGPVAGGDELVSESRRASADHPRPGPPAPRGRLPGDAPLLAGASWRSSREQGTSPRRTRRTA